MAVHLVLSQEAQMEAKLLMLATNNIIAPSSGRPIAVPSQDMVMGCYYMTKERKGVKGEGKSFSNKKSVNYSLSKWASCSSRTCKCEN